MAELKKNAKRKLKTDESFEKIDILNVVKKERLVKATETSLSQNQEMLVQINSVVDRNSLNENRLTTTKLTAQGESDCQNQLDSDASPELKNVG